MNEQDNQPQDNEEEIQDRIVEIVDSFMDQATIPPISDGEERKSLVVANREIRRVPFDWTHPTDKNGNLEPLFARSYTDREEEDVQNELTRGTVNSREEYFKWYMPDFSGVPSEKMGIAAYENFTEGTPISPIFHDNSLGRFELAKYCAENRNIRGHQKADIAAWCGALYGQGVLIDKKTKSVIIIEPPRPDLSK